MASLKSYNCHNPADGNALKNHYVEVYSFMFPLNEAYF